MTRALARGRRACRTRLLPLLLILAAGCGGGLRVPRPGGDAPAPTPLPPAEPATIALPVTVALSAVRAQLERQFPAADSLGRVECAALGGIVCHQYVYRRDTIDLRMDGDRLQLYTRLRYRGRVALPGVGGIGSCGYGGDPMKRAELRFASTLYWRNDWSLGARETMLAANLVDPCRATVFNVDATPLMQRVVDGQLRRLRASVDSAMPTVATVRAAADSIWRSLHEPVALDSGVWLAMQPQGVTVSPVGGAGGAAVTVVTLTARPRVTIGAAPPASSAPLPRLTLGPPTGRIHVPVDIEVPFADVARRATELLAGETAGQGVRVRGVQLWSAGDTTIVQLDLEGKVTGALYLVGRVGYDIATRTLALHDLRYTVQSATAMSKLKVTLGSFLVSRAIDAATNRGRWNIGELLDEAAARMNAELNRPLGDGMAIRGRMESVRLSELRTTPTGYVARVVLDGEAGISMW